MCDDTKAKERPQTPTLIEKETEKAMNTQKKKAFFSISYCVVPLDMLILSMILGHVGPSSKGRFLLLFFCCNKKLCGCVRVTDH